MYLLLEVLVLLLFLLVVCFDLCILDLRFKERCVFFCGGGDSLFFCLLLDEVRVVEDYEDS